MYKDDYMEYSRNPESYKKEEVVVKSHKVETALIQWLT